MKTDHDAELVHELIAGDGGRGEWLLVNPRMLVGLVGAVACYAWLFLMVGTSAFVPYVDARSAVIGGAHFGFIVGAAVSLVVTWLLSDFFARRKLFQFVLAVVLTVAGCLALWLFRSDWEWLPCATLFTGFGFGLLYSLYGEFICLYFHASIKAYVLGIFLSAALVCAGLLFAGAETSFFFAIVFPLVAFVAYACVFAFFHLDKRAVVDHKVSDSRHRVVWRSYLATLTAGMAAGFGLGCLLSSETVQSGAYGLAEVLVVATCAGLLFDACRKNRIGETLTMRFFLPFAAVVAFPLMFVPQSSKFVFAILLLCGSIFPITCSLSAMCKHIVLCDLAPIRAFSFGRFVCFIGIALGMALAFGGFLHDGWGGFSYETTSMASVVVFMVLVIFSASFVMIEDNYPDEARIKRSESPAEGAAPALEVTPGTPIRLAETSADESGQEEADHVARPGIFHIRCEIVAKRYGLSNRQREVLGMQRRLHN
ncbi:hypothetical protein [Gordonibacter sp.]|uniref:hypothetical protein n=1 Tax=Gordonibacter sp. TaxID=1968902 RepID=UPI002FCC34BC